MKFDKRFIEKQDKRLRKIWEELTKIRFDLDRAEGKKITLSHRQDYYDIFTIDFLSYDSKCYGKLDEGMIYCIIENLKWLSERIKEANNKQ